MFCFYAPWKPLITQTLHWPEMGETHWFSHFINNLEQVLTFHESSIESEELFYNERPLKKPLRVTHRSVDVLTI